MKLQAIYVSTIPRTRPKPIYKLKRGKLNTILKDQFFDASNFIYTIDNRTTITRSRTDTIFELSCDRVFQILTIYI